VLNGIFEISLMRLISCCLNLEKQRSGWMGEVCFLSAGKWLSYIGQRH
jgi:hypothetical protein